MLRRGVAILALLPIALQGDSPFHPAFSEPGTKEITFDGFQSLDWEAKARQVLPWLNFDRPTPPQIARLQSFESAGPQFRTIDFRAPLDPAVSQAAYLLLHASGVAPLRPRQLKGTVDFYFDASMTAVERRVFTGKVVGQPDRAVTSAAFAIEGKPADITAVDLHAKFSRRKQAGPAVYDFADAGRILTWVSDSKACPESPAPGGVECLDPESALSFRLGGQRYLLVKWNGAFCESSYTLFSASKALTVVATNGYDCDA